MTAKPKCPWYQFGLRTLLVIPLLVGLGVSGWTNHREYCLERASFHEMEAMPWGTLHSMMRDAPKFEHHRRISNQYIRAVWMPWLRLWIDDPEEVCP